MTRERRNVKVEKWRLGQDQTRPVPCRRVSWGEELKYLEILRDERRGRLGQEGAVWRGEDLNRKAPIYIFHPHLEPLAERRS